MDDVITSRAPLKTSTHHLGAPLTAHRGPERRTESRVYYRIRPDERPVGQRRAAALLERAAVHRDGGGARRARLPTATAAVQTAR